MKLQDNESSHARQRRNLKLHYRKTKNLPIQHNPTQNTNQSKTESKYQTTNCTIKNSYFNHQKFPKIKNQPFQLCMSMETIQNTKLHLKIKKLKKICKKTLISSNPTKHNTLINLKRNQNIKLQKALSTNNWD